MQTIAEYRRIEQLNETNLKSKTISGTIFTCIKLFIYLVRRMFGEVK